MLLFAITVGVLCGGITGWMLGFSRGRASEPQAPPPAPSPSRAVEAPSTLHSRLAEPPYAEDTTESSAELSKLAEVMRAASEAFAKSSKIAGELKHHNTRLLEQVSQASREAEATSAAAKQGIRQVDEELGAVRDFQGVLSRSTSLIGELREMSSRIGRFLTQISGVARRTNLLALNAGIEAARAGESGKGFAVIAMEIRSLAESSAKTVEEMTQILEEIKARTDEVVAAIGANQAIEQSMKLTVNAGEIFALIVEEMDKNLGSLGMVSESVSGQSRDTELFLASLEHALSLIRKRN